MFLLPIAVDVPMARIPWMNWLILGAMAFGFLFQLADPEAALSLYLGIQNASVEFADAHGFVNGYGVIEESRWSFITHMFMHADFGHLLGNAIFLWVFGNAICAKVGNLFYLLLYLGFGLFAAAAESIVSPGHALLGASGAINGVVGAFFILYPHNDISMFYWIFVRLGTFTLSSYWMILMWLGFDILGTLSGASGIAYVAHLAGFATGAVIAITLLKLKLITPTEYEETLIDIITRGDDLSSTARRAPTTQPLNAPTPATPGQYTRKLHVRLPNGERKHIPVTEFIRHERQGKPVNHFAVSESGHAWLTFGDWRRQYGL